MAGSDGNLHVGNLSTCWTPGQWTTLKEVLVLSADVHIVVVDVYWHLHWGTFHVRGSRLSTYFEHTRVPIPDSNVLLCQL